MHTWLSTTLFIAVVLLPAQVVAQNNPAATPALSEETEACIDCHKTITPGIVEDWRTSRHSSVTFVEGLAREKIERRISVESVPASLQQVVIGCHECHGLRPDAHRDNFDHFGYKINVVVSPDDCATCHAIEVEQYSHGKKSHAYANLHDNPVYSGLVETVLGMKVVSGTKVGRSPASQITMNQACYACHGTKVEVKGMKTVATSSGDVEVPALTNWPNQGVGRVNPDGSTGACTACHPRHSFSIGTARKPHTCAQCHIKPDVPAWDVYKESKHGNILLSHESEQTWDAVPWTVGKDFRAPSCATCHSALIVTPDGETVAERSHDFGSRVWVRIFGLPYSHPQPKTGNTSTIKNSDGLPLPTTFMNKLATAHLIDASAQAERKNAMTGVCRSCHGTNWTEGHMSEFERVNVEADSMVLAATKLLVQAWDKKTADKANPFDESIEHLWVKQWLFYANSVRHAAAMSGHDYATFENGWWELTHNLEAMREMLKARKSGQVVKEH